MNQRTRWTSYSFPLTPGFLHANGQASPRNQPVLLLWSKQDTRDLSEFQLKPILGHSIPILWLKSIENIETSPFTESPGLRLRLGPIPSLSPVLLRKRRRLSRGGDVEAAHGLDTSTWLGCAQKNSTQRKESKVGIRAKRCGAQSIGCLVRQFAASRSFLTCSGAVVAFEACLRCQVERKRCRGTSTHEADMMFLDATLAKKTGPVPAHNLAVAAGGWFGPDKHTMSEALSFQRTPVMHSQDQPCSQLGLAPECQQFLAMTNLSRAVPALWLWIIWEHRSTNQARLTAKHRSTNPAETQPTAPAVPREAFQRRLPNMAWYEKTRGLCLRFESETTNRSCCPQEWCSHDPKYLRAGVLPKAQMSIRRGEKRLSSGGQSMSLQSWPWWIEQIHSTKRASNDITQGINDFDCEEWQIAAFVCSASSKWTYVPTQFARNVPCQKAEAIETLSFYGFSLALTVLSAENLQFCWRPNGTSSAAAFWSPW